MWLFELCTPFASYATFIACVNYVLETLTSGRFLTFLASFFLTNVPLARASSLSKAAA